MLVPRMEEGNPDRDIARGIAMQGRRLQELLRQLDAALAPRVAAPPTPTLLQGTPRVLQQGVLGAGLGRPQGWPQAAPVATQPVTPVNAPLFAQQHPRGQQGGLPGQQQGVGAAADGPSRATAPPAAASTQEGEVRLAAFAPSRSSQVAPQQAAPSAAAAAAASPVPAASSSQPTQSTPQRPEEGTSFPLRLLPASYNETDGVIDLEQVQQGISGGGASSSSSSSSKAVGGRGVRPQTAANSSSSSSSSTALATVGMRGIAPVTTNIVQALVNVLTAAARLAQATGVHFIAMHPLSTASSAHVSKQQRDGRAGSIAHVAASSSSSTHMFGGGDGGGSGGMAALKPRPVRPLKVAVAPYVVQRIAAYVIDLALQCTPKGGLVTVAAAQAEGHVQLVVQHTGRMVVDRLHPASRALQATQPTALPSIPPATPAPSATPQQGSTALGAVQAGPGGPVPLASGAGAAASAAHTLGAAPGSRLLSFAMAEELVVAAGGSIACHYPVNVLNALSGWVESATSVQIQLPPGGEPPGPPAHSALQ